MVVMVVVVVVLGLLEELLIELGVVVVEGEVLVAVEGVGGDSDPLVAISAYSFC